MSEINPHECRTDFTPGSGNTVPLGLERARGAYNCAVWYQY